MRIDVSKSKYHPRAGVRDDFTADEIDHLEIILRRARFLEQKIRDNGGLSDESGSGGAAFAVWECKALVWALKELEYLPEQDREVSRNTNRGARR